jgi:hypothetical protein
LGSGQAAKTLQRIIRNEVEGAARTYSPWVWSTDSCEANLRSEKYDSEKLTWTMPQRYLEEFDFRWNRRMMNDFERLWKRSPAPKAPGCTTRLRLSCRRESGSRFDVLVRPKKRRSGSRSS